MIVDGKAIAEDLKRELTKKVYDISYKNGLVLQLIMVGANPVTERFVAVKKKFAADVGVSIIEHRLPKNSTTAEAVAAVKSAAQAGGGIVVQLPLPASIDTQTVLNAIPVSADVDVLSDAACAQFEAGTLPILPPVAGAISEILLRYGVSVVGKKAVVIGQGRLVGKPSALWLKRAGAHVVAADEHTGNIRVLTEDVDIIVSGAGVPHLIKPEMVKEGVALLDAGTSEQGGKTVGDIDPSCAEKASLFTETPGGIGPVTVAMLFKNLLALTMKG